MSKNSGFPVQKFPPDDFSQDVGGDYGQDSGYDDTVQYEMPSATQPEKKPAIGKKRK